MVAQTGVLFGLGTFVLWGMGDFLAAHLCRRHGIRSALFWIQLGVVILTSLAVAAAFWSGAAFRFILPAEKMLCLALLGVIQAGSYVAFYKGLGEGVVSVVCPISSSWSLFAVVWGWWMWGETLLGGEYAGIALLLVGIFLTALQTAELKKLTGRQLARGSAEGGVAMVLWGISFTLLVPVVREYGWFAPVYWMRVWSFLFLLPFLFGMRRVWKEKRWAAPHWLYAVVAACDVGGVFFFSEGVRGAYAAIVAPVSSAFPLITVVLAALFFREKIAWSQRGGIALVLAGLVMLSM